MSLLERRPDGDVVRRAWDGKTVVCIATGPSLTAAQIELVRAAREADAVRVIVINDAYLVAPFADVLYFSDVRWWRWHIAGLERAFGWRRFGAGEVCKAFQSFAGQRCTVQVSANQGISKDVFALKDALHGGLSRDPKGIATGQHSGHQALNIAALSGGTTILLVGYDAKPGPRGEKHAFGDHPDKSAPPFREIVENFRPTVAPLAEMGVRVFNCTPGSAINTFPMRRLEECLVAERMENPT